MDVCAILPIGNDEDTIGEIITEIWERWSARRLTFEVICVDVGSGDNTHAILAMLRENRPNLRVLERQSHGIERALLESRAQWLWVTNLVKQPAALTTFSQHWRLARENASDLVCEDASSLLIRRMPALSMKKHFRGNVQQIIPAVCRASYRRKIPAQGTLANAPTFLSMCKEVLREYQSPTRG